VDEQELAYTFRLIEIYGTPYPDDIGPGKTFRQDYAGLDLVHYMYVDVPDPKFEVKGFYEPRVDKPYTVDIRNYPSNYFSGDKRIFDWLVVEPPIAGQVGNTNVPYTEGTHFINYNLDSHGFFSKPSTWSGRRVSPGNLQAAIAAFIATHNEVGQAINVQANQKYQIDRMMDIDESSMRTHDHVRGDFDVHSTNRVTAEQTLDPNQLRGPRKLSCSSGFRREWFAHGSHWGPIPPLIRTSPIFGNNPLCPEKPSKHRRLFKCSFRTVASS
jgi:hypothetical protein